MVLKLGEGQRQLARRCAAIASRLGIKRHQRDVTPRLSSILRGQPL